MVLVKICGVTRAEDAVAAEEAGADMVGVIIASDLPTPRLAPLRVLEEAASVVKIPVVAVIASRSELPSLAFKALDAGARLLQVHVRVEDELLRELSSTAPIIAVAKAGLTLRADAARALCNGAEVVLVDSDKRSRDPRWWMNPSLAAAARSLAGKLGVAGGITPENAAVPASTLKPALIDAARGVEERPGVKSKEKIKMLVEAVKRCS